MQAREVGKLINEAVKRILLDIVIRGHGDKLIGRWSREPELQQFLEQVPYMLDRINQLHLACSRVESSNLQHNHHHHHHRTLAPLPLGQTSLNDFIGLIGQDHHWLVRTRDTLGLTPLHKAVLFNNGPIVEYILDRYSDQLAASNGCEQRFLKAKQQEQNSANQLRLTKLIDAQDKYGRSALHYATNNNHLYRLLLARGASPEVQDFRGKTAAYYLKHANQLRSKSIIHLANKLNANYQANVLSRTLRASSRKAPIDDESLLEEASGNYQANSVPDWPTSGGLDPSVASPLNAGLRIDRSMPDRNRASLSISCGNLNEVESGAEQQPAQKLLTNRSQSTVNNSDEFYLQSFDQFDSEAKVNSESIIDNSTPPGESSEKIGAQELGRAPETSFRNPETNQTIVVSSQTKLPESPLSLSSDHGIRFPSDDHESRQVNLKQLTSDRCSRQIIDQSTRQRIRNCLKEGVMEKIGELLIEGFGFYLMSEEPNYCWNLQCKRYIKSVVPKLLVKLDHLHETIATNQLLALKSLLNNDPILARIRRPYKKASLNALHLAIKFDRRTIFKFLVTKFPELINQRDSNNASCLHAAAKSLRCDRIYFWLCEHFGPQLEHLRDNKNKTASDYRQQAIRMSTFNFKINQQLGGSKRSRAERQVDSVRPTDSSEAHSPAIQCEKLIDANRDDPLREVEQQQQEETRRDSAQSLILNASTTKSGQVTHEAGQRRFSDSIRMGGRDGEQQRFAASSRKSSDVSARESSEASSSDLTRSEMSKFFMDFNVDDGRQVNDNDCEPNESMPSHNFNEQATRLFDEQSPVTTPSLPLSRPNSASTAGRLESLIEEAILGNDLRKLEHLILAGCGERILHTYKLILMGEIESSRNGEKFKHFPSNSLSEEVRNFLDLSASGYMEKISKIHQVLHETYTHWLNSTPSDSFTDINSTFHKLCNLMNRKRLIMARDPHGASPLHVALIRSDKRLVDYLLRRHPEAASAPDNETRNALHYAAIVLKAFKYHGPFKLTRDNPKQSVDGYWLVDQNCQLIYDNLSQRYGDLLQSTDRLGRKPEDYLKDQRERRHVNLGDLASEELNGGLKLKLIPKALSQCCRQYSRLLARYDYRFLLEPEAGAARRVSREEEEVGFVVKVSEKLENPIDDEQLNSKELSQDDDGLLIIAETELKHDENFHPEERRMDTSGQVMDTHFQQEASELNASQMSSGQRNQSNREHRKGGGLNLLDDLDPNNLIASHNRQNQQNHHRHHHRHNRHHRNNHQPRIRPNGSSQSIVGGIIVPTIIHNDKMDEIETYDIIYRQPSSNMSPVNRDSVSSSDSNSGSDSFLNNDEGLLRGERRQLKRNKMFGVKLKNTSGVRSGLESSGGSSSSESELDDEDERVERLSNEFESRVRREKSELQAKVDQIMGEIRLSAKPEKASAPKSNDDDQPPAGASSAVYSLNTRLSSSSNTTPQDSASSSSSCSSSSSGLSSARTSASSTKSGEDAASSAGIDSVALSSAASQTSSAASRKLKSANKIDQPIAKQLVFNVPTSVGDLTSQLASKNAYGQTYLHFIASRVQNSSRLYKILKHGSRLIGERDIFYRTARDVALQFNLANNVQVLDKFVIDLFISNNTFLLRHLLNQGYSPLIHVSDSDGNDIMLILKLLKLDKTIQLLLQMADFQRWRDELHTFIRHGYSAGVSELIKKHKDLVQAKSVHSRSSLHLAVLFGHLEMVCELLEMDPNSVHCLDNMGRSALHYTYGLSSLKSMKEIREKLINCGANTELRDVKMRVPKYYYIFKKEIEDVKKIELEFD